jgi:hypothetical protein
MQVRHAWSLAPHDITDNRITLNKGYLVSIEVMDFPT